MKTLQETFDIVWTGMKSQGFERSFDPDEGCQYRGDEDMKCAAGWCMTDEEYDETLEGAGVEQLPLDVLKDFNRIDLGALQYIHDLHTCPSGMEMAYRNYAEAKGLTIPGERSV